MRVSKVRLSYSKRTNVMVGRALAHASDNTHFRLGKVKINVQFFQVLASKMEMKN